MCNTTKTDTHVILKNFKDLIEAVQKLAEVKLGNDDHGLILLSIDAKGNLTPYIFQPSREETSSDCVKIINRNAMTLVSFIENPTTHQICWKNIHGQQECYPE